MADDEKMFRVAVLGTGAIAQVVHLPVLSSIKGVHIHALCDYDYPRAKAIANRFGVTNVPRTDDEVFRDPDVDGVIICTPNHQHEAQAIAALEAGKHVLVEKPLALTADGAARVVAAAERAGKGLMVALNNRFRPDALALRPFIQGRELGNLFYVKAGWLNRKVRVPRPTWRHKLATAGGGALIDLGVQVLDLALWMLDYPKIERVVAHAHGAEGMEVEDSAAVMIGIENGPTVAIEVTWNYLHQRDRHFFQILGTHGSASLPPLTVFKEIEHGLLDVSPHVPTGRENIYTASYRHELEIFAAVGRGEQEVELPRDQVELMRVIALAYQSIRERREITA
jgi:predicted dehydrogenase